VDHVITELIRSYGYVILFFLVGLESLGIPLPGESALVIAGAFAAAGHLSIYSVVAVTAVAAIVGDNCGYWIGRKGGLPLVRRYGRYVRLDDKKIAKAHSFFEKHGAKTVFLGRFFAVLRTWAAVLAGVAEMRYSTFTFFNITGGVVWAITYGALGYIFGRNLPKLEHYMGQVSFVVTLVLILGIAFVLGWRWFRKHERELSDDAMNAAERVVRSSPMAALRARHPRTYEWVLDRFEPAGYLGLHLTIGLLVSVCALWVFGNITEDVIHNDPITQFDLTVLDWFHAHMTPLAYRIFVAISWLGSPTVVTVLGAAVACVLAIQHRRLLLLGWAAALAGAGVLDSVLKHIIQRARPIYASEYLSHYSYSFPSGHAMGSLVCYGMLAYLIVVSWKMRKQVRGAIVLAAGVLVFAIGLSRLCLGVHYFSDVVGGYCGGMFWLASCITAVEIARRQRKVRAVHSI
jgi:membrane protein DedA with SNARE-associated domain/membrane-associated phospholipid phosphatase